MTRRMHSVFGLLIAGSLSLPASRSAPTPAGDFAGIVKAYLAMPSPAGWDDIDRLPGVKWAALPPTMLKNCLPDGGCFARQGVAIVGGQALVVVATGARTMVGNIYFRNGGAPLGEQAVLAALAEAGFTLELARCPLRPGATSTNWYRLNGVKNAPGVLSIQGGSNPRPTEGFVLSPGTALPKLQPNQLALYSEQCAAGVTRAPVSTTKSHEQLAQVVVSLLVPAAGPALYDWKGLAALSTGIAWDTTGPKRADLSFKQDPNPMMQSGIVTLAGREFSVMASGTPTQVKNIYFDEMGLHPRGEHMLGVVYEKGVQVQLVRCGPVYTESTNNWYVLSSSKSRPAQILQSIRYDGQQVQDAYILRLDGTLPARDARDRNPGSNGC